MTHSECGEVRCEVVHVCGPTGIANQPNRFVCFRRCQPTKVGGVSTSSLLPPADHVAAIGLLVAGGVQEPLRVKTVLLRIPRDIT